MNDHHGFKYFYEAAHREIIRKQPKNTEKAALAAAVQSAALKAGDPKAAARRSSRRPQPSTSATPADNAATAVVSQEVRRYFGKSGKCMFGDRCKHVHGDSKPDLNSKAKATVKATAKSKSLRNT